MPKVFVSYSHRQGDWVWNRLVPCLKAGGAEVLIDRERFAAGKAVYKQMDAVQDQAKLQLLILSDDYLNSAACQHEMARAVARDPGFLSGTVVPVLRSDCTVPPSLKAPDPIYVDLRDDGQADAWALLLDRCGADLGTTATAWLAARDEVLRHLRRNQSVNLLTDAGVKWRELIQHLKEQDLPGLAVVDLGDPTTFVREGLIAGILGALGSRLEVPPPYDLPHFGRVLPTLGRSLVALEHFDLPARRHHDDVDLFAALRYMVMDRRLLVLLIQSRDPFAAFLPPNHPLSKIDIRTVELKRPA